MSETVRDALIVSPALGVIYFLVLWYFVPFTQKVRDGEDPPRAPLRKVLLASIGMAVGYFVIRVVVESLL